MHGGSDRFSVTSEMERSTHGLTLKLFRPRGGLEETK